MKTKTLKIQSLFAACLTLVVVAGPSWSRADEVTDWNQNMFTAVFTAGTTALFTTRVTALVQASVFDAANGVYKRYAPVHVPPDAPPGASARAAVAQAAHDGLVHIYPAQQAALDAQLAASLANLTD